MRSLIKKLFDSEAVINFRNTFNYKPIYLNVKSKNSPLTISDAFLWRTDQGFKTKFKYTDILKLFYNIKGSRVEFHFYSKNNELIKILKIDSLDLSNEIEITSSFLNNIEDYGAFYIYHFSDNSKQISSQDIIANRCYLGYSLNNSLHSFVHGNVLTSHTNIKADNLTYKNIVKTSILQNQYYTIQKFFHKFDKTELFFVNPTSKTLKFQIENNSFKLKNGCAISFEPKESIITIKSNCLFLRPTIFSYKGGYFDVHHS